MTSYYKDNALIYKLDGVLNHKIIMYSSNFKRHISFKHKEVTLEVIEKVLTDPDFVYKPSKRSEDFYYEKTIDNRIFRVVVGRYRKGVKNVITAYEYESKEYYSPKHVICSYDKRDAIEYKKRKRDDSKYFKELFNVTM